jgi:hypothetical protein
MPSQIRLGPSLVRTKRIFPVPVRISEIADCLWKALAIAHFRRLNDTAAWGLTQCKAEPRLEIPDLSHLPVKLRFPQRICSRNPKFSGEEIDSLDDLAARNKMGRGRVIVAGLLLLYKLQPVDLTPAIIVTPRYRESED